MNAWLGRATLASLLGGVVLMIGFTATLTRILGVALLLAFIALGLFAIATPEYLAASEDDEPAADLARDSSQAGDAGRKWE